MTRYKLYYRLVDVTFVLLSLDMFTILFPRFTGIKLFHYSGIWVDFSAAIFLALTILAIFLVFARFMRDEYAEQVWRLAAIQFTYLAFGLLIIFDVFAIAFPQNAAAFTDWVFSFTPDLRTHPRTGVYGLTVAMTAFLPYLFLLLFQWTRWRDSR